MEDRFIRMTETQWEQVRAALLTECGREAKLYAFLGQTHDGLTVSGLFIPAEAEYTIRTRSLVELPPSVMREVVLEARDRGAAGVLELHSHPFIAQASWFSATDDSCIGPVREVFERKIPGIVFCRGVFGQAEDGFSLERWESGAEEFVPMHGVEIVGPSGRRFLSGCHGHTETSSQDSASDAFYRRSALIRTRDEHERIRAANVVVIGAGGIGSIAAQLLAAIGIGRMTLVDADRVEEANLNRLIFATPEDAADGVHKVDALARHLARHDPNRVVETIADRFPSQASVVAVASADLVVIGVDDERTRHEVLRLCVRHHVPALDMGTGISLSLDGSAEASRQGHVWFFVPGVRSCFHQMGLGGPALWSDSLREALRAAGYILDVPDQSPGSIQTLNDLTASLGVGLAEAWLMGRRPTENMVAVKIEPPFNVRVRATRIVPAPSCPLCGEDGPAGEGGNPFPELEEQGGPDGEQSRLPSDQLSEVSMAVG